MTLAKSVVTTIIAIAAAVAMFFGWQYLVYVQGSRSFLALGGKWELEFRSTTSHGSGSAKLYRRDGRRRVLVDELVHSNHYYGDDCLVYSTSRGPADRSFFAACGNREPVLLGQRAYEPRNGEAHLTEWRIDPDGVARIETTSTGRQEQRLSVAEIKRRAFKQSVRQENWHSKP